MVTKSEAFPSKWASAADLNGGSAITTSKEAAFEPMKDFNGADTNKVVIYFASKLKPLPLNLTNYSAVADIAGTEETDDWKGTKVELYINKELVKGKLTDCLRIRAPGAKPKPKSEPKKDLKSDLNDEVKF